MTDRDPTTETIDAAAARQQWSDLLTRVSQRRTRVIVEEDGVPVAALVPAADFERLRRQEVERAERFKILDEIGAIFKDVPDEEIEREVARAIAEVRAENRRREQQAAVRTA